MLATRERILELFEVDLEAGRLFWKLPTSTRVKAGQEAGCQVVARGKSYWMVRLDGRMYQRSRLIFLAKHGRWPSPECDHKNGDSLDDRWRNLREATRVQNTANMKPRQGKASGLPTGVIRTPGGRFAARTMVDGKFIHIGTFRTAAVAGRAYLAKKKELCGEWAFDHRRRAGHGCLVRASPRPPDCLRL